MESDQRPKWRQLFWRLRRPAWLGSLRRLSPLSDYWGVERGLPVDRYFIERFLEQQRLDIHGHVLEIRDSNYTNQFGRDVTRKDVLDIDPANSQATLVADLSQATAIPSNLFDCVILTQTLQFIRDFRGAIRHTARVLRPGGVVLVTVPSISRIDPHHFSNDYWRFTAASSLAIFEDVFSPGQVRVQSYGNALTAVAFLMGMAQAELRRSELEALDPYFPLIIAIRAEKKSEPVGEP